MANSTFKAFVDNWGPYVSNRQWATIREMYNLGPHNKEIDGDDAWVNLSYEEARSTSYQFGEDGIFGISDEMQYLCFSLAFWNHHDDHIKERFFGLPGLFGENEGHLGEDVKELFYYLDNTPDHSYMRALYKYPCREFPYQALKGGNFERAQKLRLEEPEEYEILDTQAFEEDDYFDIFVEYAKDLNSGSIYLWIHIQNRSNRECELTVLPTLWFRNVWEWGQKTNPPLLSRCLNPDEKGLLPRAQIKAEYLHDLANYPEPCFLWGATSDGAPSQVVFTENATDPKTRQKKWDNGKYKHVQLQFLKEKQAIPSETSPSTSNATKAGIGEAIIAQAWQQHISNIFSATSGTKGALVFHKRFAGQEKDPEGKDGSADSWDIHLRLYLDGHNPQDDARFNTIDYCRSVVRSRRDAAQQSYCYPPKLADASSDRIIYRQALATLIWNKQFYHYNVLKWMFYRQLFISELEAERASDWANKIEQAETNLLNAEKALMEAEEANKSSASKAKLDAEKTLSELQNKTTDPFAVRMKTDLNNEWRHMGTSKIMVMPDKWEYPYFCTWDSAFHAVTMSLVDIPAAQELLRQLVQKDCMHPSGQMPGCEFDFSDPHPPIHAWAVLKVFEASQKHQQHESTALPFLEEMVWKLWHNFSWWSQHQKITRRHFEVNLNQDSPDPDHPFYKGGFMGLDNISVVNRSNMVHKDVFIEQVDSVAWLALFSLSLLKILVKLGESMSHSAMGNHPFVQMAGRCLDTFVLIVQSLNDTSSKHFCPSWNKDDSWFYDILRIELKSFKLDLPIRVRSLIGVIPLFATTVIEGSRENPVMKLIHNRYSELKGTNSLLSSFFMSREEKEGVQNAADVATQAFELTLVNEDNFKKMLERILNHKEFLSEYGIRSMSKFYDKNNVVTTEHPAPLRRNSPSIQESPPQAPGPFTIDGMIEDRYGANLPIHIAYEPGRTLTKVFGSKNSNWRGPVWVQINYLFIDMLRQRSKFSGEKTFRFPADSINDEDSLSYVEIARRLSERLINLFRQNPEYPYRPCHGQNEKTKTFYQKQHHAAKDEVTGIEASEANLILFYEFFHGENGSGLGASHQSWTTIVANLISELNQDEE